MQDLPTVNQRGKPGPVLGPVLATKTGPSLSFQISTNTAAKPGSQAWPRVLDSSVMPGTSSAPRYFPLWVNGYNPCICTQNTLHNYLVESFGLHKNHQSQNRPFCVQAVLVRPPYSRNCYEEF